MEIESVKKKRNVLKPIKIGVNIILLVLLVIIGVQNAHTVSVSLLNWEGEISLTLLVFLSGILGGLVVMMANLIKW